MIYITSKLRNTDSFSDLVTRYGLLKGSKYVRGLGVLIDIYLTFQQHIKKICKSASFVIFKIRKIRELLDWPTTTKLTHAFISPYLHHCILILSSSSIPTSTSNNSEYCCKACYIISRDKKLSTKP